MNWANELWRPFRRQKQRRIADMYAKQPTWYVTYWKTDRTQKDSTVKTLGPLVMAATSFCGPKQWLVRQWLLSTERKRPYPFCTAWPERSEEPIPKKKAKTETVDEQENLGDDKKHTKCFGTQTQEEMAGNQTATSTCNQPSTKEEKTHVTSSKDNSSTEDSTKNNAPKEFVSTQQKPQRRKLVRRPPAKPDKPLQRKRRFTRREDSTPQVIVTEDVCKMVRMLRYQADLNKGDFFESLTI